MKTMTEIGIELGLLYQELAKLRNARAAANETARAAGDFDEPKTVSENYISEIIKTSAQIKALETLRRDREYDICLLEDGLTSAQSKALEAQRRGREYDIRLLEISHQKKISESDLRYDADAFEELRKHLTE